jgi:hypothetical protein
MTTPDAPERRLGVEALGRVAIEAAIAEALKENGGKVSGYHLAGEVADRAGAARPRAGEPERKWNRRCQDYASRMAKAGVIRKVGLGERLPEGGTANRWAWFYTAEQYHAEVEAGLAEARRRAVIHARWETVTEHMAASGFPFKAPGRGHLTLGQLEQLATILGYAADASAFEGPLGSLPSIALRDVEDALGAIRRIFDELLDRPAV